MDKLEARIVFSLLLHTARALTVKLVLLSQHELTRWYIFNTLVDVADCQFIALSNRSARDYEQFSPTKYSDTIRSAAMIYQIGRPVEASSRPQKHLV